VSIWQSLSRFLRRPAPVSEPLPPVPIGPNWVVILREVGFAEPAAWAAHISFPAARRGITAGRRAAAFAATIAHESDGGRRLVESLNYAPKGLSATWPSRFPAADAERMGRVGDKPADQRAIAERAYGGRMGNAAEGHGDGFLFRGRGLIQLTGRDAYRVATDALGLPILQQPDLAAQPNVAAEIACWTWAAWKGCNTAADRGEVETWRRLINGGLIGLSDVKTRYRAALSVQGAS
jgi:putative chitinase